MTKYSLCGSTLIGHNQTHCAEINPPQTEGSGVRHTFFEEKVQIQSGQDTGQDLCTIDSSAYDLVAIALCKPHIINFPVC